MVHETRRRLAFACCAALALICACAVPAAAQLLPETPQGELPDLNEVPVVKGLADTVEDTTGVDLPNLGSTAEDPPASSPSPQPADPPSSSAPADPAPAPSDSVGAADPAPVATAPQPASSASPSDGGSSAGAGSGSEAAALPGSGGPGSRGGVDGTANRDPGASQGDGGGDGSPIGALLTDFGSLPWTLLFSLLAIAALGLAMAGRSAVLARISRRLRVQRHELREDVGALQSALLPDLPERIGEVELSVAYRPEEGPAAGGDFHDVVALDGDRLGIVVGDVSGHGREALTITALAHYTVRAYLEAGVEPRAALRLADEALGGKLGSDFVTVLAAVYDPERSSLVYATAGHPAPILIGAGADSPVHVLTPPPIGVGPRTGFRQTAISVPPRTQICFFSDGLVEARLGPGNMLDREGLVAILGERGDSIEAPELLEHVTETTTVADDMTLCVIRPLAANGDGTVAEELDLDASPGVCDRLDPFLEASGMPPTERRTAIAECRRRAGTAGGARLRIERRGSHVGWRLGAGDSGSHPLAPEPAQTSAGSRPAARAQARA